MCCTTKRCIGPGLLWLELGGGNYGLLLHCVALIKGFFDPEKHSMLDLADVYKKFIVKMDKHALIDFVKEIADYAKIYRKVFISDPEQSFEFNDDVQRLRHILIYSANSDWLQTHLSMISSARLLPSQTVQMDVARSKASQA